MVVKIIEGKKKSLKKDNKDTERTFMVGSYVYPGYSGITEGRSRAFKPSPVPTPVRVMDLIGLIRAGVPGGTIKAVAEKLDITLNELYSLLHVTPRTAQRLINTEKLDPDMSDRIVQLMKVHDRCMEVFESREKMIRWLKTPNYALGDNTPLSLLDTTDGIELVENSLTKIEYGVFG